jgi:hypothetical protein
MTTIQYAHSPRWYRFALMSLGAALAIVTALAVYFAIGPTTESSPTITRVTVTPTSLVPNCSRPLVPC